ncbi:MAG TPA: TGS domain-containing protein, partial [Candidatus Marinimicrobia bacterium]|nr:TGS domain-containing protein [Candidatus Neomarinimicrobiota bacterium]
MNSVTVTLPDKSTKKFSSGVSSYEIATQIGARLAQDSIAVKVNCELYDINTKITEDSEIEFVTINSVEGHEILLHSTAHLMAQAVKILFPKAKVTIGPSIDNRFYYDFDVEVPFTEKDIDDIEDKMRELASQKQEITRCVMSRDEAIDLFKKIDESYKVDIISEIDPKEKITVYTQNSFIDLCRGPHLPNTG